MSILVVVCAILLLAVVVAALLSIPFRMGAGGVGQAPALPAESADARGRLAAMAPPSSAVVGELPVIAGQASLRPAPIDPSSVDLSTIGCGEDEEATAAAVWREVRRSLAQRGGKAAPAGKVLQ